MNNRIIVIFGIKTAITQLMKNTYFDLIDQSYYFPQEGFDLREGYLTFHGVSLKHLINKYGTPFKLLYLPRIGEQIRKAKNLFSRAIRKNRYDGAYHYCYCTKSSHFRHVIERALDAGVFLETSSGYDLSIVETLLGEGKIKPEDTVVCNGFKQENYIAKIADLLDRDAVKVLPVLDNFVEIL